MPLETVPPRPAGEPRVLSFAQQRLWYLDQLVPESPAYNVPFASRLSGPLEVPALEKALDAVMERHEVLRTAFLVSKGAPIPFPIKNRKAGLQQTDLRHLAGQAREIEVQRLVWQEAARPFHLGRDCM